MNPNTRVVVCCYAGDRRQVEAMFDFNRHHACPIVVLSPEDSAVEIHHPGVENRAVGPNEYTGYKSLARFRKHLEILLTFPEDFFFINDSDSFCLTPQFPNYIYAEPDLLWTNLKIDDATSQQAFYPEGFPHLAFQPPWFFSRNTIKALLAVADDVTPNPNMLFIDYWLVQLAVAAGVQWKGFPGCISWPMHDPYFARAAWEAVRYHGTTFVHAVKTRELCDYLMDAQRLFATAPAPAPSPAQPPYLGAPYAPAANTPWPGRRRPVPTSRPQRPGVRA